MRVLLFSMRCNVGEKSLRAFFVRCVMNVILKRNNNNASEFVRRLVKTMQKHVPVDIYGKCGKFSCPRTKTKECYEMIEREYKFYLSFENGLCVDYVTEKLFNVMK